jgi:hypothetical protein
LKRKSDKTKRPHGADDTGNMQKKEVMRTAPKRKELPYTF